MCSLDGEEVVLASAVGAAPNRELGGGSSLLGGLAGTVGGDLPGQLPHVPATGRKRPVLVLRQFPVKSSLGLIFTLKRVQG